MSRDLGICTGLEALEQVVGGFTGLTVIDIGSGEGALEQQLAEAGAVVTGIDPLGPEQSWTTLGTGRYCLLRQGAETLPVADASVDLVLFIYSLHHIPGAVLPGILTEARRVLRNTGSLYIAEPLAEGPAQEVAALYHDETTVRQRAADILATHAAMLFKRQDSIFYRNRRIYGGFEDYAARMKASMRFNDFTEAELCAPAVRERFDAVAGSLGGIFDQPVRIDLLRP
ncbi:class I SAM-dependent methyltransferase [Acidisphaera sp. L21]|jgi:ubiquinone/menaquinone biosynthesis C-methylase UbiE|uniref:class I SAM-dependent methyltransferase n=1 Tax=Acidisphaera sp. L21 TaxID=1641851 RepID=UPI00131B39E2|nr:class I SAM-dependent methyltransferase [Acidisphaera sp. L21]